MDDRRRYLHIQQLDLEQILCEANNRWLRPIEICEILCNYQKFYLTPDPPVRPPAGSLFLFDRKALRYFRKDGHRWRKKKDGKTVREAHEKLKAGSVDVLHCYYAHGEDNESFQRRSYWMLDQHLEHIVLVHYREVKEGYKFGISRLLNSQPVPNIVVSQVSSEPCSAKSYLGSHTDHKYFASSPITSHWTRQTFSSEFDDGESGDDLETSSFTQSFSEQVAAGSSEISRSPLDFEFGAAFTHGAYPSLWPQIHGFQGNINSTLEKKPYLGPPGGSDMVTCKLIHTRRDAIEMVQDVASSRSKPISDNQINVVSAVSHLDNEVPIEHHIIQNQKENVQRNDMSSELKNLDSFGRWMDKEIGVDCDDSLMASDSGQYWNTISAQNDDKEVSSLSCQIMLDMDSLSPSLSQEQHFSICDFSPDWAYAGVETKVLICGKFLGNFEHSVGTRWSCMFGEIEVPAEVLTNNCIRCHAPTHAPGRIPFYITCCNRLACSEVREFEYRKNPPQAITNYPKDELKIQIRLAKFLYSGGLDKGLLDCLQDECDKCKLINHIIAIRKDKKDEWKWLEGGKQNPKGALIQKFLIDRLIEWLVFKIHEGGKGPNILDEGGQGVMHLTAALGYELAIDPIIAAGVSPNFRDAHGRTGLHWASFFGREEAVLELVRLGADPGAVDDPTLTFPGGRTAADLASSKGHKGIAGYLAEAHLTRQVTSLKINKIAANKNSVRVLMPSNNNIDEQLSMKGSLMAVQNSTHAAALIQDLFRTQSFRHKQLSKNRSEISEVSLDLVALGSLNRVHKMHHFSDYLHTAAIKIQQKYRGWKGRNEFLKIRNRIVKIQAHVRGYQIRRQYKKVVWSVSIVEKVILRWRRKGSGLRGFRVDQTSTNLLHETEKVDDYEFLRIGRKQKFAGVEDALSRVRSMARHPEARNQYMRLVAKFDKMCDKSQLAESERKNLLQDKHTDASD